MVALTWWLSSRDQGCVFAFLHFRVLHVLHVLTSYCFGQWPVIIKRQVQPKQFMVTIIKTHPWVCFPSHRVQCRPDFLSKTYFCSCTIAILKIGHRIPPNAKHTQEAKCLSSYCPLILDTSRLAIDFDKFENRISL